MKTLLAVLSITGIIQWTEAALILSGAASPEEISTTELERYSSLHDHPLRINSASRSRLEASGLFSAYQTASLLDYRQRSGDILSLNELALVDGFSEETAGALAPFIDLSGEMNGRNHRRLEADVKLKYGAPDSFGAKSRFTWDDRFELCAGNKSWSGAWYGPGHIGMVAAGDLNLRFGQGLLLWNGFNISGFGSIQAFRRNAGGISTCMSYTDEGHLRGAGAEFIFGNWTASAATAFQSSSTDSWIPATAMANLSRHGRSCTLGATCALQENCLNASADFKFSLRNLSLYGEAGYAYGMPQAITGMVWTPKYKLEFAARGEWTADMDAALGVRWDWFFTSLEYRLDNWRNPSESIIPTAKLRMNFTPEFHIGSVSVKPTLQWQERYRPLDDNSLRSDIRTELELGMEGWTVHGRFEYVYCKAPAAAGYVEGGYKGDKLSSWLRGGLFKVDNWEDRIYIYERDIPGSYNVPARYGRGCWLALCTGWKFTAFKARHSLALRLAGTWYTRESGKDPRCEIKLQYSFTL